MFVKKLKEESRLIDQSSNVDSFRFPALPNRINHVEIIARKTLFDLTVVPKGKCEVRPEGERIAVNRRFLFVFDIFSILFL